VLIFTVSFFWRKNHSEKEGDVAHLLSDIAAKKETVLPQADPKQIEVKGLASTRLTEKQLALPLYIYPSSGEKSWRDALQSAESVDFIIANVNNGPGDSSEEAWRNIIPRTVATGIKIYGYVYTLYGRRDGAIVDEEISRWLKLYPEVSGFFLDEVSDDIDNLPYYVERYKYIKTLGNKTVVINPGTVTDEGYMNASDVNTIFESSYDSWQDTTFPTWINKYSSDRFYAIVYNVPDETKMQSVVSSAFKNNITKVFITDGATPSDSLPYYFEAETKALLR